MENRLVPGGGLHCCKKGVRTRMIPQNMLRIA